MLLISEKYLEQLIISHSLELFVSYIPVQFLPEVVDDSQQFGSVIDIVVVDSVRGQK